ncbi:hypothetical protein N7467_009195 [Penicillium canescens]|nr:hypothetical protein N7467_009195 [Penicillium canescens]
MLIPFVGMFAATALWSQWFAIPGLTEPGNSLTKRLCGSFQLTMELMTLDVLVNGVTSEYDFPADMTMHPTKVWNFDSGTKTGFHPTQAETLPPPPLVSSPMPSSKSPLARFFRWAQGMFSSHDKQQKSDTPHLLSPKHLPSMERITTLFYSCSFNPISALILILVLLLRLGLYVQLRDVIYYPWSERFFDAPEGIDIPLDLVNSLLSEDYALYQDVVPFFHDMREVGNPASERYLGLKGPPAPKGHPMSEGHPVPGVHLLPKKLAVPKELAVPKQSAVPEQSAAPQGLAEPKKHKRNHDSKKKRQRDKRWKEKEAARIAGVAQASTE